MDRNQVKMVRDEIQKALDSVGATRGLTFDIGRITFSDKDFSVKIRGIDNKVTSAGSAMELDWNQNRYKYPELEGIVLGQRFRNDKGDVYRIVGLKPKNFKYPVIAQREDGKQFKFSPLSVNIYVHNTL